MFERNTALQPHEFTPGKIEGVIGSVKNLSAEKIDLVIQQLKTPMQPEQERTTYFLRFWRLAEGIASMQEIPMNQSELARLGRVILRHAKDEVGEAPPPPSKKSAVLLSGDDGAGYVGVLRYKGEIHQTEHHDLAGVFEELAQTVHDLERLAEGRVESERDAETEETVSHAPGRDGGTLDTSSEETGHAETSRQQESDR